MLLTCTSHANEYSHQFAVEYQKKYGGDIEKIAAIIDKAEYKQTIIDAITRPAEGKPWHEYQHIFISNKRVKAGLEFWKKHQATLERAEKQFNVPQEIIVAIIGVETYYGQLAGSWSPLDALYTLGFFYERRKDFFRSELEHLLKLVEEESLDLKNMKSSYAGAMGYGQFIPSSYRHYAIDFDGDGKRDLLNNPIDAIGSVANYFAEHGWKMGQPVMSPTIYTHKNPETIAEKGIKPHTAVKELNQQGIHNIIPIAPDNEASLIKYEYPDHNEYWMGLNNFYVITRYNRSPLYARSVYSLSIALKQAYVAQ
jgi:membrane-bound lytic murein transglycosylase B